MRSRRAIALVAALGAAVAACEPDVDPTSKPRPPQDFLRDYVALGDALTAGVQSGALLKRFQVDSYPAILGNLFAVSLDPFEAILQPFVTNPGLPYPGNVRPEGALSIVDLDPLTIRPLAWSDSSLAEPGSREAMHEAFELNRDTPFAFRNLGIPGALAFDVVNATDSTNCFSALFGMGPNYLFNTVLRPHEITAANGDSLTPLGQALSRTPRLATVWLGFSEIQSFASRGVSAPAPYDAATFEGYLDEIVSTLQDSVGARVVLANVPRPRHLPFYTTVPPFLVDSDRNVILHPVTSDPIPLLGPGTAMSDLEPGVSVVDPTTYVLLTARTLLERGFGFPDVILVAAIMEAEGVDQTTAEALLPSLFPGHGQPLPGSVMLTAAEMTDVDAVVDSYNAAVASVGSDRGAPVVDAERLFATFASGVEIGGIDLSGAFVTGGLFGLDGLHPTSFGYALIANEFGNVINAAFGASVPSVNMGILLNPPPIDFD